MDWIRGKGRAWLLDGGGWPLRLAVLLLALGIAAVWGGLLPEPAAADPDYKGHKARTEFCGDDYDGCGQFCIYGNCTACTQCCTCWETCERTFSCTRTRCDARDDEGNCTSTERYRTTCTERSRCNFVERTEADGPGECEDGGGFTCACQKYKRCYTDGGRRVRDCTPCPRSNEDTRDCAPCLSDSWEVYGWRGGQPLGTPDDPLEWDFKSPYLGLALNFGRIRDQGKIYCSDEEFAVFGLEIDEFQVGPPGHVAGFPTKDPSYNPPSASAPKTFAAEGAEAPYLLKLTKPENQDRQAVLEVRYGSFDRDSDTLQYRFWPYFGEKPPAAEVPYIDLPLAVGRTNLSSAINVGGSAGRYSFQIRKLDENDVPSPGSRVLTEWFGMDSTVRRPFPAGGLTPVPVTVGTPLPPLEGGLTRPAQPEIDDIDQDETSNNPYRVQIELEEDYSGTIQYRYWKYSGHGFNVHDRPATANWTTAAVTNKKFVVVIPDSELIAVRDGQGSPTLFAFQVRQLVGFEESLASPTVVKAVWSFEPVSLPAWYWFWEGPRFEYDAVEVPAQASHYDERGYFVRLGGGCAGVPAQGRCEVPYRFTVTLRMDPQPGMEFYAATGYYGAYNWTTPSQDRNRPYDPQLWRFQNRVPGSEYCVREEIQPPEDRLFRQYAADPDTGRSVVWRPENSGDSYSYEVIYTFYGADVDFTKPGLEGFEHFPSPAVSAMYMMFRFQERPSGINGPVRNRSNPFGETDSRYEAFCPEPED